MSQSNAADGTNGQPRYDARLDDSRALSDREQTLSDANQTASDADQGSCDADGVAARSDQRGADVDQRAADRDQAAADHDQDVGSGSRLSRRARATSRGERRETALARGVSSTGRATGELARSRQSTGRDETARRRDMTAAARDRLAERRDQVAAQQAARLLQTAVAEDPALRAFLRAEEATRVQAADDRARAAKDRQRAAADRELAAADRRQARIDLMRSYLDSLTGVYTREMGNLTLQHEIDRARRSGVPFVLAFLDVDGLNERNDRQGHAAGDALLRAVADAIRSELRSYDPIVRIGGDEFVCGFTNTELKAASARVEQIKAAVGRRAVDGSITVGLALLRPDDTLDALTARADAAMYEGKPPRPAPG